MAFVGKVTVKVCAIAAIVRVTATTMALHVTVPSVRTRAELPLTR